MGEEEKVEWGLRSHFFARLGGVGVMEIFARSWKLGENGEVFSGFSFGVWKIRWRPNSSEKVIFSFVLGDGRAYM